DLFERDAVTPILLRAASSTATISNTTWAGALAATAIEDLVLEISSMSAAAALMQKGLKLDFGAYAQIRAPGRIVDGNEGGSWVAEGNPVVVRAQRITAGALLQPRKLILITAFTSEILAQSNLEAVSRAIIGEGLSLKPDATMFDANPGDASRPPGLLNGV